MIQMIIESNTISNANGYHQKFCIVGFEITIGSRYNNYKITGGIKFGSKFGSMIRGWDAMASSLSTLLLSMWCPKSILLAPRLFLFCLHVLVSNCVVVSSEQRTIVGAIEQSTAFWLDIELNDPVGFRAHSQYFRSSETVLFNSVLVPNKLSVELISTLKDM